MARAWISWREDDFLGAEREFRSSAEFCSENAICSVWRLNAGHVLFMQDKYKEAAAFYEPIVRQHSDDVGGGTLNLECIVFLHSPSLYLSPTADHVRFRCSAGQPVRLLHYDVPE